MKAIIAKSYGGPEVLEYADRPDPKVGPDSFLIRVKAAGVNPVDWKIVAGYLDPMMDGHFPLTPGWDVAGVVEAVGADATEYAVGDEVIGYVRKDEVQHGTYAELVAAPVRTLAHKPASLSWQQAAGLPLAGLTAYQSLKRVGVRAGETVLVHAAAGGVGSLAVQIAVAQGARVIGTASERNHDFLRSLGAEPVTYGDGLADRVRALAPQGVDAAVDFVGGGVVEVSQELLKDRSRVASIADGEVKDKGGHMVWVRPDTADLTALGALADAGKLSVPVEAILPLSEAAEAFRRSMAGRARGKIVLEVS
ncbi:NADPH:quinone reductase [Streptomyces sp. 2224.1]|uniref:NADP-dependent oxidoreductase n=1 Tax=unclassified Streptomyces TaxID=2593676 RepID=UPI000887400A|nr:MULTISPECIES: NADP-dependent oxidoreductase [unclassified Streptomyces]PBC86115.1 NADPH:quinone reductase-like Zn-dependent oxidoreductase [Streptomyces sp. 2321.6]SDQ95796.1 NADPH:quinone reductase [Streptomyces sp. KS_16]SED80579.1 NADPH:quinone reductase [Streptomyces sp. 2112.3]SED88812.1 NADPH:quinone reductase [Streptomyces sp. 2133.1]SEE00459.1 NADPH:quinone reductase [Streptomyces sp. 2224.1]